MTPAAITEALQAGATDFILKERLAKLVPSIRRPSSRTETQRDLEEVRQELVRHAELLELANDAIVISDASGKISYWNRGAERMYGWSREEVTGCNVHELLQTGPPEALATVLRTLQEKRHWEGEIRQVRRDGVEIVASTGWTLQGTAPEASLLAVEHRCDRADSRPGSASAKRRTLPAFRRWRSDRQASS